MKKEDQNEEDRLSDLPDSAILHILSFLDTKQAHQTLILSTRWKNIAKHLPILRLSSSDFNKSLKTFGNLVSHSPKTFSKLVSRVLSLRDHSTTLHTLELEFGDFIEPEILKNTVEYAISHNVRLLRTSISCDFQQFPPCLFSSQTLTSLDLYVHHDILFSKIVFPNSLNLPALTTLTLRYFKFCAGDDGCAEPFSAFSKLSTLIIQDCQLLDAQILCISSTTLVDLTVDECEFYPHSYECKLSTPSLCNLNYTGSLNQKLCHSSDLRSLKHVYIDVNREHHSSREQHYPFLLNLLLELANIKLLTVTSTTLQVLSLIPDLFKVKLTSLYNLESLRVNMKSLSTPLYVDHGLIKVYLNPEKVCYFLLQNSPSANVDII